MGKHRGFIIVLIAVYPKRFTGQALCRTFLCGVDEETGIDYSHRKDWLEKRMFELCDIFSVSIFAYAIMDRFLRPAPRVGVLDEDCIHHIHVNNGRYSSQALLDEAAVFSSMAYVDLNPIRAGIAERIEESKHTAINNSS